MPEIKNTFLKSRMNKDTEARILPQGEYRDAQNASVSASEDASVGSLENIRGNKLLTDLGLTDFNIEIIGQYADVVNNRIFFFLTNFTDASANSLGNISKPSATAGGSVGSGYTNFVREGASNYIAYCQLPNVADSSAIESSNITFDILVSGTFLNFSKTHPISGINIIENLLFFTDNRNQPRKINVDNAISNPLTYYTNEDHISVAKYAPYEPISFLKNTTGVIESTLINEKEQWLPAFWGAPGQILFDNSNQNCLIFNENAASSPGNQAYSTIQTYLGTGPFGDIGDPVSSLVIRVQSAQDPNGSYALVRAINTGTSPSRVFLNNISGQQITNIKEDLGWGTNTVFLFSLRNPHYNSAFVGDTKLLEDKFVRFSYRFKYDDNEYSLAAPFTQHAFVPKQYGYFLEGDDEKTKASSIVEFMENQITTAGLVINLPYKNNELVDKLKVNEIQLLYKASDDLNVKVIADIKDNEFNQGVIASLSLVAGGSSYNNGSFPDRVLTYFGDPNSNNTGSGAKADITVAGGVVTAITATISGENYRVGDKLTYEEFGGTGAEFEVASLGTTYIYNYSSEKPIKVLTDEEVTRVSDIVPMRAQTQEVVGNRVIYGNFLQNNSTPINLNYNLSPVVKGTVLNPATPQPPASTSNKEFLNNTIKQNRAYQVGIVLQDRYGRASNVIINQLDLINKNSTIFVPYRNGGLDPLSWPGDSLQVTFNSPIPSELSSSLPYNGLWKEGENPLGWYTYKIVVQQQEQDYYNVYVPGVLSGNIIYEKNGTAGVIIPPATDPVADYKGLTYSNTSSVASIALFNDNINKIPRDLKEVGPTDNIYGSSVVLYNRVKQTEFNALVGASVNITIGQQNTQPLKQEVTTVRPFNELGEWTTRKNIDLHYENMDPSSGDSQYVVGSFIYPGSVGDVDPFFLRNNKNPLIATINTQKRMGFTSINQESDQWHFADKLMVFETEPFKSNIDIYYETSTTGVISELNNSILTSGDGIAATDAPFGLTELVVSDWFENSTVGQVISNTFGVVNSSGAAQGGSTALSTQVKITEITNSNGVIISESDWPIAVERVSAIGQAPTFRLLCNKRFVFEIGSDRFNNYNITFEISTNDFDPVQASFSNIGLNNINPVIYRSSPAFGNGESNALIGLSTLKNITLQELENTSSSNPMPTTFLNNTGTGYDASYNAVFWSDNYIKNHDKLLANPSGWFPVSRFSFITNGYDPVSVFNTANDFYSLLTSNPRIQGITFSTSIINVRKFNGRFKSIANPNTNNPDVEAGKFYTTGQIGGSTSLAQSQIDQEFNIRNTGTGRLDTPQVEFKEITDDDFISGSPNGYRGCHIYHIDLQLSDASRGPNSLSSAIYSVVFIITKNKDIL
tara:strand:+ start:1056 stop:5165 length:4110 start_codon:yes stop_codon:yes gene_type:complete